MRASMHAGSHLQAAFFQRGSRRADCWGLSFLCGLVAPIEPRERPGSAAGVLLDMFRVIEGRGAGDTGATAGARRRCEDVSVGACTGLGPEGVGAANLSCCRVVMGGSQGEDSPYRVSHAIR